MKRKFTAAALAFLLGTLGIHNFYLGYKKRGAIQLTLTLISYIGGVIQFVPVYKALKSTPDPLLLDWETLMAGNLYVEIMSYGVIVTAIWSSIELIMILANSLPDAQGRRLQ